MDERLNNLRIPNVIAPGVEPPSRKGPKTFKSAEDISAQDFGNGGHGGELSIVSPYARHFHSRFSRWIRAVALVIVLVFVPEQASWAFNYNPLVLWGNKTGDPSTSLGTPFGRSGQQATNDERRTTPSDDEIISARVAASVQHLLDKVAYKEKTRIQLQLTDPEDDLTVQRSLLIDSDTMFTRNRIREITGWLKDPNIHPLNCGVYAMKDLLASQKVEVPLEELSVATLIVDLMSDIVKPGEPKMKTSLYAINKVAGAYGLNFKPAKLDPADILKLKTPFIANFGSEHFVTVNAVDEKNVYFTDIGRAQAMSRDELTAGSSGFVYAKLPSNDGRWLMDDGRLSYEIVPDSMQAFVWGNRWRDNSDNLPGLMTGEQLAVGLAIQVAGAAIGAYGNPNAFLAFSFNLSLSQFSSSAATACVTNGVCSEGQAMILATAISFVGSYGAGLAMPAKPLPSGVSGPPLPPGTTVGGTMTTYQIAAGLGKAAALGAVSGYAQYEIAKRLDDSLSDRMDSLIKQRII